jgi:HSP20 family protein
VLTTKQGGSTMRWLTTKNNQNLTLNSLKNEMDTFFDNFFDFNPVSLSESVFSPKVDITENGQNYQINAELPGLTEKEIKVSLENNTLSISAEKSEENSKEEKDMNYIVRERSYGSFQRSIKLPQNIDGNQVKAEFKNGVLSIEIPKAAKEETKKIAIKVH